MKRSRSLVALAAFGLAVCVAPRLARADAPGPGASAVHVVALESEDADDQADALTAALRGRLKETPGFSLGESQQALGMLMAALKCKGRQPDADCEQKIANQIAAERFLWGSLQKSKGQATVELHLFRKGKGSGAPVRETYPDSLKDPRDPALQKVASRLLNQLLGVVPAAQTGTARVRANNYDCPVAVDGERKTELEHGAAQIELPPGPHTFELLKPCATVKKTVTIPASGSALVDLSGATSEPPKDKPGGGGGNIRPIIGWSLIGGGVVAGALGAFFGVRWLNNRSDATSAWDERKNDRTVFIGTSVVNGQLTFDRSKCTSNAPLTGKASDPRICDADTNALTNSTVGWVAGGIGAALVTSGIVVLLTGGSKKEEKVSQKAPLEGPQKLRLAPTFGNTPGAVLSGEF